jgi:DNA-binding FadR family transcriptional regulator
MSTSARATARKPERPAPATTTAVFERLLREIVSGAYPPGARLPAERELAVQLKASRPTLREALRRLAEWGLVEARRGSGIAVRPKRDWSIDVLPAYMLHGAAARGPEELGALVRDLLAVRRSLFLDVLRVVGPRIAPGSLARAREHVTAAWAARAQVGEFVRQDFEAMRAVVEAADFVPALWLLGSLTGVYASIATHLTGAASPPSDYLASFAIVFDALESHRVDAACATLTDYLERHDKRLLATLGIRS